MNENSPICARPAETSQPHADRVAQQKHDAERDQRLADDDQRQHGNDRQWFADQDRGIEQHADRDEEQHGKGVLQRQGLGRRLVAEAESPSTTPAKKAPSANETPNTCAEP